MIEPQRFVLSVCLSLLVAWAAMSAPAQPEAQVADRLVALDPSQPTDYFELGEELADIAQTPEMVDLARRLLILSFELSEADPAASWIRPSACIALAHLERAEGRDRWLRALATRLDTRYGTRSWDRTGEPEANAQVRLQLAEFVGLVRSGDGPLAKQRLDSPGVTALADEYRDLVIGGLAPVSIARLRTEAEVWPCPECGNSRSVVDPNDRQTGRILCPTCRGNPGPVLAPAELAGSVAFEAVVLRADAQTWSAETAIGRVGPLRDPDPAELPVFYGIDTRKSIYRDGAWIAPPGQRQDLESERTRQPDQATGDEPETTAQE